MQNAWKNPFAAKREDRWQSYVGELSDEDDSCPDQVVYHEDHLENLFGLYNRVDEAKRGGCLQRDLSKTEGESFKDHLTLAIPSDRETVVWGALEASELSLQESCRGPENDAEQLESYISLNAFVEEEQLLRDCLENGLTNGLEDKINAADASQQTESSHAEVGADFSRPEVLRDGWDHANADIDDIHDHVVGPSSIKLKGHSFVKPKGRNKKSLNLSFRSMRHVTHAQRGEGQRNECQKLSLAQKLQSLTEPSSPTRTEMQAVLNCSNPCTRVPISVKLLELVQSDGRHSVNKKAKKTPDLPLKTSSKPCVKEDLGKEASMPIGGTTSESINNQFRKALLEAPPMRAEEMNRQGKVQGASSGFAARLQKVLERERNIRSDFSRMLQTRLDSLEGKRSCMDVKIVSKSLEARLSACECNIMKFPEAYGVDTISNLKAMVIFNMQANSQLELECGTVVRLYPPWQEVLVLHGSEAVKTILCTYFCEVVSSRENKQTQ